ncbi:MAG TPA: AIR synthase related protein [Chloroflexota bacterium]|nr:AIR synthase related protein [Chloroflexota bacterium]
MPSDSAHGAYAAAGVDYDLLDPGKRLAQEAARATADLLARHEFSEVAGTRGESAYVVDAGPFYLATLTEGLGTKNLVADAVRALTGRSHYDQVARDAVATILNDLATVGAAPLTVTAYWGTGDSQWFADQERMADLVRGWAASCVDAGAAWGGGETQALAGIIQPGTIDLAGAAVGIIRPKSRLLHGDRLQPGDAILIAPSSGIHANGLTLARRLAERLPEGYATPVPGDPARRGYGEALLDPSPLYGPLLERLQQAGVDLHYAAHVTGHGWRKLMRAERQLTYRVQALPPVPPVLAFLQDRLGLDHAEAYGTFNMGAGFALFVASQDVDRARQVAGEAGSALLIAGQVEDGPKQVILEPIDVTYAGSSLNLR